MTQKAVGGGGYKIETLHTNKHNKRNKQQKISMEYKIKEQHNNNKKQPAQQTYVKCVNSSTNKINCIEFDACMKMKIYCANCAFTNNSDKTTPKLHKTICVTVQFVGKCICFRCIFFYRFLSHSCPAHNLWLLAYWRHSAEVFGLLNVNFIEFSIFFFWFYGK